MTGVGSGVRVRTMTEDDVARVMELERATFLDDAWSESLMRQELAEATRRYFVAETRPCPEDPRGTGEAWICGYAGLRTVPPEGDVQTIAVDEGQWGKGVGTTLLTHLLDTARDLGIIDVFLEVRSDNPRARELYRRFGFGEIGVRRGYYRDADAIVMRRSDTGTRGPGA
ncbi:ribosomal protein S18-alanine N-acetyltransferase [Halostreptopolyspora alba]|uniref:Ribosomal-protein-alanine N-acetyltransferase n=1 Tax=Halostreptopolyspora alba TaxID=2487137 RepID=A0A3N0E7R0_9ACTN|nr:ribosomal-protein-alanine N-acetyltransferase [Nocardiopsaceae bacterium YIM 96095]